MDRDEARHRVMMALLQADNPTGLQELGASVALPMARVSEAITSLVVDGLAVRGPLLPGARNLVWWAARWERGLLARTEAFVRRVGEVVGLEPAGVAGPPDLCGPAVSRYVDLLDAEYQPPEQARIVVFLQCSVRRPFSTSPSHASMKRAIEVATGMDARHAFAVSPVHVVVLASYVGPVPYELEGVYPANIRAGGVVSFGPEHYAEAKPILVDRMARYLDRFCRGLDGLATFTQGRYGDIMAEAGSAVGVPVRVLPEIDGDRVYRMGSSRPRKYWEQYWAQLVPPLVEWLGPEWRRGAADRLAALDVELASERA